MINLNLQIKMGVSRFQNYPSPNHQGGGGRKNFTASDGHFKNVHQLLRTFINSMHISRDICADTIEWGTCIICINIS